MKEKREKFVELAEKRMTRALKDMRLVGNLSNRNNYSYTDSDVQKIVSTLEQEVKNLKSKFSSDDEKKQTLFKLL